MKARVSFLKEDRTDLAAKEGERHGEPTAVRGRPEKSSSRKLASYNLLLGAINNSLGSYRRTSGLRPPGAAPAKRGSIMGALKGPHEVARVAIADPPADLLNR